MDCHSSSKNLRVSLVALITSCVARADSNTTLPVTAGLLLQLAITRREMLPLPFRAHSMNRPWAGSNRYKISELMSFAKRCSPPRGHSRSIHPHYLSVYASRCHFRQSLYRHPATLDTGHGANAYPGGDHTRLSSNHFQSARAIHCSSSR